MLNLKLIKMIHCEGTLLTTADEDNASHTFTLKFCLFERNGIGKPFLPAFVLLKNLLEFLAISFQEGIFASELVNGRLS